MLSNFLLPLYPEIFGKSMIAMAEEVTGVSGKTLRSGGPKRPNKMKDAKAYTENWLYETFLRKGGFPPDEAKNLTAHYIEKIEQKPGTLTNLTQSFISLGNYEWPQTEFLARILDTIGAELLSFRQTNQLHRYKKRIIDLCEDDELNAWFYSLGEFAGAIEKARNAKEWADLIELTAYWIMLAIFQFLACWDAEFQTKYFTNSENGKGMKPQPLFLLVQPMMNPNAKQKYDGSFSARGIFHLPLRRLLSLCFCLAHFHRYGNWPQKKDISRNNIAAWIGEAFNHDSEKLLAKIYRGTKGISQSDFSDMWSSMCDKEKNGIGPMPPWPIYIAAQFWTLLFVKSTQINGARMASELISIDPAIYKYWWDIYYRKFSDNGIRFGDIPWPKYLIAT
jgi:hypothetical protein